MSIATATSHERPAIRQPLPSQASTPLGPGSRCQATPEAPKPARAHAVALPSVHIAREAAARPNSTACAARQPLVRANATCTGGAARTGKAGQTRRKTSVPLVPPKPKLFLTARSIFICRASLAQ